jgi:hypothetical protein
VRFVAKYPFTAPPAQEVPSSSVFVLECTYPGCDVNHIASLAEWRDDVIVWIATQVLFGLFLGIFTSMSHAQDATLTLYYWVI